MNNDINSYNHAFTSLKQTVDHELTMVNQLLLSLASDKDVALIEEIGSHIISAGGKRIRPVICLAMANLFGVTNQNHIYLAAAIECIHTATLLHDDVIDESQMRRGIKTANHIWGDKASILVGDFLFSQAFKLMVKTESIVSLGLLSHTSAVISQSEVTQLQELGNIDFKLDLYLKLINAKTAQLFAAASAVGAISAGATQDDVDSCSKYGEALGMCFQIIDDILDYTGDSHDFGKKLGNDFYEGKVTAPLIFALQNADSADRAKIQELFSRRDEHKSFIDIRDLIISFGGITSSIQLAEKYCHIGQKHLLNLPDNNIKHNLTKLIHSTIDRDY